MSKRTLEELPTEQYKEVDQLLTEYTSQTELFTPEYTPASPDIDEESIKQWTMDKKLYEKETTKQVNERYRCKMTIWQIEHVHEYVAKLIEYADQPDLEDWDFRLRLINPHMNDALKQRDELLHELLHVTRIPL